ncbi:LPAT1 [Symbiodinium natans]|uniref:LPAT1 protein n=1 Tax=Symbiodinium natans TaxID=878477 RepID=A0A812U9K2_9DINO|nr:LPAT1 [Symbiodinium natans]
MLTHATLKAYLVLAWRALFRICPWIQLETFQINENFLGVSGKPTVLLMNHLSFLDAVLAVPMAPLHRCADVRVLVANYVFSIPLLGRVMRAIGLSEVPFKAAPDDVSSMAVEKEAMEEQLQAFAEHIKQGGVGAWFPEGLRNRGDPLILQDFRAGAFVTAVQTDVDVWCLASVGTNVCWPVKSLVGGLPARIGVRMWHMGSSHELLAAESLPMDCGVRAKAIRLAELAKASMQAGIDDLAARGFSGQEAGKADKVS